jgi:putative tryptophan/tyrosine transport system substrate-binding protein
VQITYRHASSDRERLRLAAQELVAAGPDVIVAQSNPALSALRQIDQSIPTVFVQVGDAVGSGFVDSLARPSGNITGFTTMEPEMGGKWLELLREASPTITHVAALLQSDITANFAYLRAVEAAGSTFKVAVQSAGVRDASDITRALTAMSGDGSGGLIVLPSPVSGTQIELIVRLAIAHRLPLISAFRYFPQHGGLMSYGPDVPDLYRRAASYVDRVLRGEKPSNLPVQVPTKFELVINLKTAKALGLDIPPTLLARADEVIE